MLTNEDFQNVLRCTPLISIDLLVVNQRNEMLVGLRRNRPAQNVFFVPGGRIRKGERFNDALTRIMHEEIGIHVEEQQPQYIGHYDHIYENDNFYGIAGLDTHYVSIAYLVSSSSLTPSSLEPQHLTTKWVPLTSVKDDPTIHVYTKHFARDVLMRSISSR